MKITAIIKIFTLFFFSASLHSQTLSDIVQMISEGNIQKAKNTIINMNLAEDESLYIKGLLSVDADSAEIFYQTLIKTCPESRLCDDVLFKLGQKQYMLGLYHSSKMYFVKLRSKYRRSNLVPRTLYWIALCHYAMNDADSAQIYMEQSLNASKSSELDHLLQAELSKIRNLKDTDQPQQSKRTYYAIQVGAFSNENNANMRKAYFQREGFKVRTRTKTQQGKLLHLVWVGEFGTRPEAMAMSETIKMKYGVKCHLVSETVTEQENDS